VTVPGDPLDPISSPSVNQRSAESEEERLLARAILELNGNILGFVLGIVAAIVLFLATNWLVIRGGEQVGPHLLGSVPDRLPRVLRRKLNRHGNSFAGGMVYSFAGGYVAGRIVAGATTEWSAFGIAETPGPTPGDVAMGATCRARPRPAAPKPGR
jgi:hypothetical protein